MDALDRAIEKALKDPEFRREWEASEEEYQISRAVIEARTRRGLTQSQLADASGMDQRVISHVETGETLPTVRTFIKIARGLGDDLVIQFVPREKPGQSNQFALPTNQESRILGYGYPTSSLALTVTL